MDVYKYIIIANLNNQWVGRPINVSKDLIAFWTLCTNKMSDTCIWNILKAWNSYCKFVQISHNINQVPLSYTINITRRSTPFKLILLHRLGLQIIPKYNNRAWLELMYSPTASPTPGLTAAAPSMSSPAPRLTAAAPSMSSPALNRRNKSKV